MLKLKKRKRYFWKGDSVMRKRKMVAPIVITALMAVFLFLYLGLLFFVDVPVWVKIAVGVILAIDYGVSILVLVERIKEIRSGEEDDLSQY